MNSDDHHQPSLPWLNTPPLQPPADDQPPEEDLAEDQEEQCDAELDESVEENDPLEELLEAIQALREDIAAEGTESRRTARRLLEVLKQLGGMIDALSLTTGSIHDLVRASQRPAPPEKEASQSLRPLVDLTDRIDRIAAAAARPPSLPSGWFLPKSRLESAWREDRGKLADSIDILSSHAHGMLKSAGLEKIPVVGCPFDPHCMEAQEITHDTSVPDHTVLEEISPGWRESATGNIIRPARVRVSRSQSSLKPLSTQ
jgi:molecular chaperone GrpE (heat shock protein)